MGRGLGEIQPFLLLVPSPSKTAHATRWLQMSPRGLSATQPVAVAGLERPPPQGRLFSGQKRADFQCWVQFAGMPRLVDGQLPSEH